MANSVFIGYVGGLPYSVSGSTVTFTGTVSASVGFLAGDGTSSAPSFAFVNDTGMGLYRSADNEMRLVAPSGGTIYHFVNGGDRFYVNASSVNVGDSITLGWSDVVLSRGAANVLALASGDSFNMVSGSYRQNNVVTFSTTAPTIASGFGTNPSIVASNGTSAFTINVGTGGTASAGVITMPAATTGWICHVENITRTDANGANQRTVQIASTTTSITVENQTISTGAALAWTASDVLVITAVAY